MSEAPRAATIPARTKISAVALPTPRPRTVTLTPGTGGASTCSAGAVRPPPPSCWNAPRRPSPESRSVLEALGRAQFDTGRYAAAADSFRQIVEASPSDDYAHFGLGLALARGGNPAAAAEHLALAAAMRPELRHYTDALRGVRATLRARSAAEPPSQPPPAGGAPV